MIAIVVGHRKGSQGAVNVHGVTEWVWNMALAQRISIELTSRKIDNRIVLRPDKRNGYTLQADLLNRLGPTGIVEIHFNGSENASATGTETLCHPKSAQGLMLAADIQDRMVACLGLPDRGVKRTTVNGGGVELKTLTRTLAPAVIVESHFGSNASDVEVATIRLEELAAEIAEGIEAWAKQ